MGSIILGSMKYVIESCLDLTKKKVWGLCEEHTWHLGFSSISDVLFPIEVLTSARVVFRRYLDNTTHIGVNVWTVA